VDLEIEAAMSSAVEGLVDVYKIATLAPASASPLEISRPIPRVPPVTIAVFPRREKWERTGDEGSGCDKSVGVLMVTVVWLIRTEKRMVGVMS
jgi:hypothetical protein